MPMGGRGCGGLTGGGEGSVARCGANGRGAGGGVAGPDGVAGGVGSDAAGAEEDGVTIGGGTTGPGTIWIWSPVWLVAGRCGHWGRCGTWRSPSAPGCA